MKLTFTFEAGGADPMATLKTVLFTPGWTKGQIVAITWTDGPQSGWLITYEAADAPAPAADEE